MLKYVFEPRSVAIVGASRDPRKDGHIILRNIIDSFPGKIYPVNPNADEICGLKAYPSLLEIPDEVDLAVIIVPARIVPSIMEDCAKKGVKGVIIESMGFAEIGVEGKKLQDKVVEIAVKNGIKVIGPNCTGIVTKNLVTSFFRIKDVPSGNVTIIGQSGLLAAGLAADIVANKSLNIRAFCSIGNKCDVNENDLLEYFEGDEATRVIAMYLESFSDGQKFMELARKITRKKPIIILYGGKTEAGAKAALSHTASLASNSKVVDAALRQSGCIQADDFNELIDFAKVFSTQPIPRGNKVAIITAAGSVGVVLSDLCEKYGLKITTLSNETIRELKKIFPEWLQPTNPVDLWFVIERLGYTAAISESMKAVLSDPNVDCLLLVTAGFEYSMELVEKRVVQQVASAYCKPVIICLVAGYKEYKDRVQEKLGREIPVFTSLSAAVKALSKLSEYYARVFTR